MRALFVGRFQPFHMGHLEAIKNMLKECDEVIILIGSAQFKNTFKNPFSKNERMRMIKETLDVNGIERYRIITLNDLNNDYKWTKMVIKKSPDCDVVYSNNKLVRKLFKKFGYKIKKSRSRYNVNGTLIRRMMLNSNEWKRYVPRETLKIIKKIKGVERIRNLMKKNENKNRLQQIHRR